MQRPRRLVRLALIVGLVTVAVVVAVALRQPTGGATIPDDGDAARSEALDPTRPSPALDHVYVIVLENNDLTSIIAGPRAPFLSSLAGRFGVATEYLAVARPSQPCTVKLTGMPHVNGIVCVSAEASTPGVESTRSMMRR